jgi:predicted PurR-regulated permease PerM
VEVGKKIIVIYSLLAIFCGVLSLFLELYTTLIIALAIYFAPMPIVLKAKTKKKKKVIFNTFFTYFLIWIIVVLTIYNL